MKWIKQDVSFFNRLPKYQDFSLFKVGDRAAVCHYGASWSMGVILSIETKLDTKQQEYYKQMLIQTDSHFDGYKRSKGITQSVGQSLVSEYAERPVWHEKKMFEREGLNKG
jgi:hypothetical protein